MKVFSSLILLASSWSSVQSCSLESCFGTNFKDCAGWTDNTCRSKATLNLKDKQLSGYVPGEFYTLFGRKVNGDADNGLPKVALTKVVLSGNQLQGSIRHILDCSTIKEVDLEGNPLTSQETLTKAAPSIESLNLASTSQKDLKWLNGKFPNLKTLNLANNQLTDASVAAVFSTTLKLVNLNLANNNQLTDSTVAALAKLTEVTTLDLSGNDKITDLTALTSMTKLKSLKVHSKLEKQKTVLISGQPAATKRTLLISASVSDVNDKATANGKEVTKLQSTTATNTADIQQLQAKNKELEDRIKALEDKWLQVRQECVVPSFTVTNPAAGDNRRRLAGTGCISGTAANLLSGAALAVMTMFL